MTLFKLIMFSLSFQLEANKGGKGFIIFAFLYSAPADEKGLMLGD